MNQTLTPEMQFSMGIAIASAIIIITILWARRRRVEVLAHRGFFVPPEADNAGETAPPAGPHWFVKIFNHTRKPVVITHVGWVNNIVYIAVTGRGLPSRIEPGGVIETWISEAELGEFSQWACCSRHFEAITSTGRRFMSRLNRTVLPSGYVA